MGWITKLWYGYNLPGSGWLETQFATMQCCEKYATHLNWIQMCTVFIQMLLKVKLHKPCGFVVKVTITKEMLFSGIVVLVDWRVCVESVVASVVDFVTSIEVICVGWTVDSWSGSEETMGVMVVDVVAALVVCDWVLTVEVVVVVVVGEVGFVMLVVLVGAECVECVEDSVTFIYTIHQLFLLTACHNFMANFKCYSMLSNV